MTSKNEEEVWEEVCARKHEDWCKFRTFFLGGGRGEEANRVPWGCRDRYAKTENFIKVDKQKLLKMVPESLR